LGKAHARQYLKDQFGFDRTLIYAWFRGEVLGSKHLVYEDFRRILLLFLSQPPEKRIGITTQAHVYFFLSLGPEEYRPLLDDPEIRAILETLPPGSLPSPFRAGIPRETYEQAVWETWNGGTACVVLHGTPGSGKTHLLREIHRQALLNLEFDVVITLHGGGASLTDFLEQAARTLDLPFERARPQEFRWQLNRWTTRRPVLILLDDCQQREHLEAMTQILGPQGRLLVTTRRSLVAPEAACRTIEVAPYTWEEVQAYARHAVPEVDLPPAALRDLAEQAQYNPLGLQIALALARRDGIEPVLQALKQPPPALPVGIEGHLFRFLYLAWEMLDPELQHAWAQIGALPAFAEYHLETLAALWEIPPQRAAGWMTVFCRDAGLCQRVDERRWRIHEQTQRFAAAQFAHLPPEEQAQARGWLVRRAEQADLRAWERRAYAEARKAGLRQQVRRAGQSGLHRYRQERLAAAAFKALLTPWRYHSQFWRAVQRYSAHFSSETYVRGYLLERRTRRLIGLTSLVFYTLLLLLILPPEVPGAALFAGLVLLGFPVWWLRQQGPLPLLWADLWDQRRGVLPPPEDDPQGGV
jgi:hypothetical protein